MEIPRDVPGDNLLTWLAKTPEDAIDRAQPIVDPHHHLWDRRPRQDLPAGARSHQRYLGDDLVDGYLLKKADALRISGRRDIIKTWSRRSEQRRKATTAPVPCVTQIQSMAAA